MLFQKQHPLGRFQIRGDHLRTHFLRRDFGHPPQHSLGLGRITKQGFHLGRTEVPRINPHHHIPHRKRNRGVGGIFYDWLGADSQPEFDRHFAYTKDVGETFLSSFPAIARRRMAQGWTAEERHALLKYRGLYAEFNLVYDRGTTFGQKTGGNTDAILMSLPPEVVWE